MLRMTEQTREAVAPIISPAEIVAHFAAFEAAMGNRPPPEEECTTAQLSALKALLKAGPTAYVGFALLGAVVPEHSAA